MVDEKRDTVVVENDRSGSNPLGWIIGLLVVIILVALFFMYGGFGLFNGGADSTTNSGDSVNIDAPDSVNTQTPSGQ